MKTLRQYIETEIIPRYDSFDAAHRRDHVEYVIAQSLKLAERYDVDRDMVYAIAAYHDTGLAVDRKTHHLESGRIIRSDQSLRQWFDEGRIETMAQAVGDPREGHWNRMLEHLNEKYAEGGYLRLWIPESDNAAKLRELHGLIRDRDYLESMFDKFYKP